jgi:hypothetical protein
MYVYAPKKEGSFDERYGFKSSKKYVSISCTEEDIYSYYLPLIVWAWQKFGFEPIIFVPDINNDKLNLAISECKGDFQIHKFKCEPKRKATFSQCSRLYASCLDIPDTSFVMTSDVDMLPCNEYFTFIDTAFINVIGEDLMDYTEFPICYIGMSVNKWRHIFGVNSRTYQECLEQLINPIEGENIRGEQWSLDQAFATRKIKESGLPIMSIRRGKDEHGYALNRADRGHWQIPEYCIDAHLPRNGQNSLQQVLDLLKIKFPNDKHDWFIEYTKKFYK